MTIRRWPAALLFAAMLASAIPDAGAQSMLDTLRARRAQGAANPGAGAAVPGLEDAEPSGGTFALPTGARIERDLAYGSEPAQKVDVYVPAGASRAPIIVMVHGGGWIVGDKGNSGVVANKAKHWLAKGYIFVSVNYRMNRPPNPLEQAEDAGRALAFVQAQAASWGGDASRIVLMGHSSGAHLATLLTASPGLVARSRARPWLATISLDSAAVDVVELMTARHFGLYDRVFGADPARWNDASPLQQLSVRPVPLLLVCSSRRNNSCPAANRFAAKASALGGRATVLPVELNHGEINTELGRTPGYTAAVDDFLRSLGLP